MLVNRMQFFFFFAADFIRCPKRVGRAFKAFMELHAFKISDNGIHEYCLCVYDYQGL